MSQQRPAESTLFFGFAKEILLEDDKRTTCPALEPETRLLSL